MSFREALARSIAPHVFAAQDRINRTLMKLDALGLDDAEKTQAIEMAAQLAATGADDLVDVIGKIAATGRLTPRDIASLENQGIQIAAPSVPAPEAETAALALEGIINRLDCDACPEVVARIADEWRAEVRTSPAPDPDYREALTRIDLPAGLPCTLTIDPELIEAGAKIIWHWYVGPTLDGFDKPAYAYDRSKAMGAARAVLEAALGDTK